MIARVALLSLVLAIITLTAGVSAQQPGVGPRIYVSEDRNHRIVRIDDMTGAGWTTLGTQGSGQNQFSFPAGIFVDPAGRIYVADAGNHRLDRLVRIDDMSGSGWTTLTLGSTGMNPLALLVLTLEAPHMWSGTTVDASGRIYIADFFGNRLLRVDAISGAGRITVGGTGNGARQFRFPAGVAVDPAGRIYVADAFNNRIVRMDDMTGAGWTVLGTPGSGVNQFSRPSGIFVR